jgi:hypothetical protein
VPDPRHPATPPCYSCALGEHERCDGPAWCPCSIIGHTTSPDPAVVREQLDVLQRQVDVRQGVVDALARLLHDERRECDYLTSQLGVLRRQSAALADGGEQRSPQERHPGHPWTWAESVAGSTVIRAETGSGVTMELARDDVSGRVFVAPAGTLPPAGDGWTLGRVVLS